ncbi:MAG: molybdopterin-synthase adenylyltransferase MoeB [Gemmatimonadetes bacterium]|nr:molybdopterin-synthase adenylyltransferase MoeB [Gemmatimonadota bacterium]
MADSASTESPRATPLTGAEMGRYSRHLVLPEVGVEGQERLKAARVLVVGAGGLGSPAAMYLAAAGVGTVGLVDADVVDVTNLQRQILHGTGGVGRPKVASGQERLIDINPHVDIEAHPVRLTSENALDLVRGYDVVVDGCDNFPTRYLVNDACVLTGRPNVYGSVYRWEGQLSVFATDGGPCYRCLFREPPPPGLIPNCAEAGVFGALPGIIGAAQAMEAIKVVLGVGASLAGRLQIFDALSVTWRELEIRRDPGCPVCGDHPTQTDLIDYEVFCGVAETEDAPRVRPEELVQVLEGEPRPFLLDVREPFEWDICNLASFGAVLIPRGELENRLDEIPRERPVLVYCRTGARSRAVQSLLFERGFADVLDLDGGILACAALDPTIQRY